VAPAALAEVGAEALRSHTRVRLLALAAAELAVEGVARRQRPVVVAEAPRLAPQPLAAAAAVAQQLPAVAAAAEPRPQAVAVVAAQVARQGAVPPRLLQTEPPPVGCPTTYRSHGSAA
jgi:hypothetical protein